MFSVCAHKKTLDASYAIELAASGAQRSAIIRFNESLVGKGNGLLSHVKGAERFATVGCGHTTAWCKHQAMEAPRVRK